MDGQAFIDFQEAVILVLMPLIVMFLVLVLAGGLFAAVLAFFMDISAKMFTDS